MATPTPITANDPSAQSGDYKMMADYWQMVDDIMGGAPAMRGAGERYLPRFEDEGTSDYDRRVKTAPFTPLYDDAFQNLASKPFSKEVRVDEDAPDQLKAIVEDIDNAGTHLHVFARELFKGGINYGLEWLMVDYAVVPQGLTKADEDAMGARPYWVRIQSKQMIAVYMGKVGGKLRFTHARIAETEVVRDGYEEQTVERIRELNHDETGARWTLWEKREGNWDNVASGVFSIGFLPLIPFFTGEPDGNGFAVKPPLRHLAHMQVTEYQMEANLAYVQTNTAFPTHVFQGVAAPEGENAKIPVGPREVLFFPPHEASGTYGDYKQVEPSGAAAETLRTDLETFRREMREAGKQPLLPQSGNLTATATAIAEAKAQSAVEAWALELKDVLELAWVYTCRWLGLDDEQAPDVVIHTDFAVGENRTEEMSVIDKMHDKALISGEQYIDESLRRGILAPTYDRDEDKKRIEDEIPTFDQADDVLPQRGDDQQDDAA